MIKPFLALACLASFAPIAAAQLSAPDNKRLTDISSKVGQLDALIQIVPLALTKEQIPPLLMAVEKVRQKDKELAAQELKDLTPLEAKLDRTVREGIDKGVYPPSALSAEVKKLLTALALRRQLFNNEMVEEVFKVCKATLNEGQIKVMERSLKPELLDPSVKGADMDADARIKFFIRKVVLDPPTYDVLLQMSKRKDP